MPLLLPLQLEEKCSVSVLSFQQGRWEDENVRRFENSVVVFEFIPQRTLKVSNMINRGCSEAKPVVGIAVKIKAHGQILIEKRYRMRRNWKDSYCRLIVSTNKTVETNLLRWCSKR